MLRLVLPFLESSILIRVSQHYNFIHKDRLWVGPWQKVENDLVGEVLDLGEYFIMEKDEVWAICCVSAQHQVNLSKIMLQDGECSRSQCVGLCS